MATPPIEAASPAAEISEYRMNFSSRLVLQTPRLVLLAPLCFSLYLAVANHIMVMRLLGALLAVMVVVVYYMGARPLRPVVVRFWTEGNNLHFMRRDGQDILVPRRGKALRKSPQTSNPALLVLNPAEGKTPLALVKQDKKAMALLADLERRGIVRGPGAIKEPSLPARLQTRSYTKPGR